MSQYILVAKIALIVAAICTALWIGYRAGKNEVLAEYASKTQDAIENAKKAQKAEIEKATHEAEYWRKIAVHLQQNPVTVTEWRTKIVENNPNCTRIVGIGSVWNESRKSIGL